MNLNGNHVSDLTPIQLGKEGDGNVGWSHLQYLTVDNNQIDDLHDDLQPLELMMGLQGLSADYNALSDVTSLGGLKELRFLSIDGRLDQAGIADIGSLKELTQLHWLSLSGQQIEDVTSLGGMTDLEYAYLHDNRIRDIEVLAGQRIINNGRLANWGNAGSQENPLWQFSFADVPSYPDGVPAYSELGSGWLGNVDRVRGAYDGRLPLSSA